METFEKHSLRSLCFLLFTFLPIAARIEAVAQTVTEEIKRQ